MRRGEGGHRVRCTQSDVANRLPERRCKRHSLDLAALPASVHRRGKGCSRRGSPAIRLGFPQPEGTSIQVLVPSNLASEMPAVERHEFIERLGDGSRSIVEIVVCGALDDEQILFTLRLRFRSWWRHCDTGNREASGRALHVRRTMEALNESVLGLVRGNAALAEFPGVTRMNSFSPW